MKERKKENEGKRKKMKGRKKENEGKKERK